jgi:hypothetical protein
VDHDRPRGAAPGFETGSIRCVAVLGAIVVALIVASGGAHALGGSPVLTAPLALSAPTIDGSIDPAGEWADAGRLPLAGQFGAHPATLYVKHDATYLYVLLIVADDPPPPGIFCCSATLYFDDNHNGIRDPGEDSMAFGPADQSSDGFFTPDPYPTYADDSAFGGTDDTFGRGSYDSSGHRLILEARKPLCSGDSHDFCLQNGSILGFTVDYFTSAQTATLDYPATPDDFAHFADLRISPTPVQADLEIHATADKQSVNAGESITYTMTVTNNGPESATTPVVDAVYMNSGVTVNLPRQTCPCKLATLTPGSSATIRQTIIPTSVTQGGGTISLKADVSATGTDPLSTNNADEVDVHVTSAPATGESVAVMPSSGTVSVRSPGSKKFVPLGVGRSIATGSEVDTSNGKVRLAAATPSGALQTVTASAGKFQVTQPKRTALTTLRLSAPIKCGPGTGVTVLRSLRVDVSGKFRTVGARGYVMAKGPRATWLIRDLCVPVGRSLDAAGARTKREVQTCLTPPANPSRRSQADLYDPQGQKQPKTCTK